MFKKTEKGIVTCLGIQLEIIRKTFFTVYKVNRKVKESSQDPKHWALMTLRP